MFSHNGKVAWLCFGSVFISFMLTKNNKLGRLAMIDHAEKYIYGHVSMNDSNMGVHATWAVQGQIFLHDYQPMGRICSCPNIDETDVFGECQGNILLVITCEQIWPYFEVQKCKSFTMSEAFFKSIAFI